ncbi:MAG: hypothetical protein ABW022_07830, partial [Actinoplanes sp.]
ALRHIAGRPSPSAAVALAASVPAAFSVPAGSRPVARVMAERSAAAITGVGAALALACLGNQVTALAGGYFDATGSAVALVGLLLALSGVVIGWRLVNATRSPLRSVSAVVVGLLLVSAGAIGYARWRDQPPYPASALQATATIRLTDRDRYEEDARQLGVPAMLAYDDAAGQHFVGRVDYKLPPAADGAFHLVVIDKRQNRVAPMTFGAEGSGWSSTLSGLARRYPWLSAMADSEVNGGFRNAGSSASVRAGTPGPIAFVGAFPGDGLTEDDLMVVLIFTGPNSQTYWAERISG